MIIPSERISPPADGSKPVTDEYIKALNLNKKILVSAQLAQQSLYEMCTAFKEMRDSKLYKELGYSDFGDYCEQEVGMTRRQVYKYVAIAEKLPEDFVNPGSQIGVRKLYLLTTLSDEERAQITADADLESATVKELEQQIKQLRADKDKAIADKSAAEADSALKSDTIASLESAKHSLDERIAALGKQIKDLENRPVEVATQIVEKIPDDYIAREAYERLVDTTNAERERLDAEHLALTRKLHEAETALEEERNKPADSAEVFNAYLKTAYDALNRLVDYVKEQNNTAYSEKATKLIDAVKASLKG